jgi:deoxyribodipyrimidine photolyase-related protein
MKEVAIVFPHQLFLDHPALQTGRQVWLIEESLFFTQFPYHKQKLLLHRASMQAYADRLRAEGMQVSYIESGQPGHDIRSLDSVLNSEDVNVIYMADPADDWLTRRMAAVSGRAKVRLEVLPTPGFMNTTEDIDRFFDGRQRFHQTDFYIHQRKIRDILLAPDGKPKGDKWTFDTENRKRFPKGRQLPPQPHTSGDVYTKNAAAWVQEHFPNNPGNALPIESGGFPWAWTHEDAERLLDKFLHERLVGFGDYEDAMVRSERYLHHSVLTPMLNTGLLTPEQVVSRTLEHAGERDIPLNDLEGFIRQIIGWREFIRGVYQKCGRRQRTKNYWGFSRKIPPAFWTGDTGIVPIDDVIRKVLNSGYAHHIERLMVLGNFFLLCEFDPDEVYQWFMALFIDAYDWVMVPNVYGMTQFADGGLMTTKPYISGSNYILKMSDWKEAPIPGVGYGWTEVWDALFWRFMHEHRSFFLSNPRLGMLIRTFDQSAPEKRERHLRISTEFLASLDLQTHQTSQ